MGRRLERPRTKEAQSGVAALQGWDATRLAATPMSHEGGSYTVELPVPGGTHWFLLTADAG